MELNSPKISVVCWIYIVVAQWNNRPPVDMSLYSLYYPDHDPTSTFPFFMMLLFCQEATPTDLIVFFFTRSGLEPTICRTRSEHANH